MNLSKSEGRIIGYSLVFIFYFIIFLLIYTAFGHSDKTVYPIELTYPSTSSGQPQGVLLRVNFNLKSDKTISEGVNLNLTDITVDLFTGTEENANFAQNISWLEIGFPHAQPAFPMQLTTTKTGKYQYYYYQSLSGASFWMGRLNYSIFLPDEPLEINSIVQHPFVLIQNREFNFPVAGDYSPSIIIGFFDKSILYFTDNEVKLHVPSKSELQIQTYNQVSGLIAVALFVFSLIQAIKFVYDSTKNLPEI
jgi:hypothetical protein